VTGAPSIAARHDAPREARGVAEFEIAGRVEIGRRN
jgi:hypothetical protein